MVEIRGGDKMEKALANIAKRLGRSATLRVGFLEGATYPADAESGGAPVSVAMVAAVQNFGSPAKGIPPRPFFSNMVADKSEGWGPSLGKILKMTDYNVDTALTMMGEGIKGQLIQSIRDTNTPPLADATVDRKGFMKPLIDSGHMQNSIDFEVINA